MPTSSPRINAVVERSVYDAVEQLARIDGVSVSRKARDLIVDALEAIEDAGLAAIVAERRRRGGKFVPLAEAKRRLGIRG